MAELSREGIAAVDARDMLGDVLDQPAQMRDALERVRAAGIEKRAHPGGLRILGMGGSAIGGDLAAAAIGRRRRAPVRTVRGSGLEPTTRDALVLCASYSGETAETLACFADAGAAGAERVVLTTGGRLAAAARSEGVPVIGVPSGMQPRAAVAYMLVGALECAALCGAAPSLRPEIQAASEPLRRLAAEWGPDAPEDALPKRLARRLRGHLPVIYGAAATAPVAFRWKTQINENAKLPAFSAELPEADHNELNAWEGAPGLAPLAAIFLDDGGADESLRRRVVLTAREIGAYASALEEVPAFGSTPVERVAAGVMLGDFLSVYLAVLRGVDPTPVEAIERFKRVLAAKGGEPQRK